MILVIMVAFILNGIIKMFLITSLLEGALNEAVENLEEKIGQFYAFIVLYS